MQTCSNCLRPYCAATLLPRILITCGHTFCHSCLADQFVNKAIKCFECDEVCHIDTVEQLPKNQALLKTQSSNRTLVSESSFSEDLCLTHQKKLEAFCHTCSTLLCIDCII